MTFSYFFFFFTLHVITLTSTSEDWCYEIQTKSNQVCKGPSEWKAIESCGKERQSPINIVTKNAHYNSKLKTFHFKGYNEEQKGILKNNGHSAQLNLTGTIEISGGGLSGTYTAIQLHFHWGSGDVAGSEHTIDGEKYPVELHIVHEKKTGRSESGGSTTENGNIAVLGFFFEESSKDNNNYDSIIKGLENIISKDKEVAISKVKLQDLIPEEKELELYYRYEGSLTTPGCDEVVNWTVFPKPIELSKSQIEAFYTKLKYSDNSNMTENFRPVQKRGSRNVYTSGVDAVLSHSRHLLLSLIMFYVLSIS